MCLCSLVFILFFLDGFSPFFFFWFLAVLGGADRTGEEIMLYWVLEPLSPVDGLIVFPIAIASTAVSLVKMYYASPQASIILYWLPPPPKREAEAPS